MENKKSQKIFKIIMLIIVTALITYIVTVLRFSKTLIENKSVSDYSTINSGDVNFSSLKSLLESSYIGTLDEGKMIENALKGYVEGTGDKYSTYLTKEEMEELKEETSGKYVGIGIYVTNNTEDNTIVIVGVMKESPALEVGIQAGDIIEKVEGVAYTGEQLSEAISIIKGEENTDVNITIVRENEEIEKTVKRKKIIVEHVASKVLENNIGYIQIDSFDDGVAEEFEKQYNTLKESNIRGLIVDLRSNGGGVVDEATGIADLFTEKNETVLITKGKSEEEKITKAKKEKLINGIPVVVLINQATASASEILAGALRDNYGATIVGMKSYGKGVIQTVYSLSNGAGLKVTTDEYYTPNHVKINEVGIEPDIEVELTKDAEGYYETDEDKDAQLLKAIEKING